MAGTALYDVGLRLRAAELYDMGARPRVDCSSAWDTRGNRDLCQDFGHGSLGSYAAMRSPSSTCLVRSKNDSMARAGTW